MAHYGEMLDDLAEEIADISEFNGFWTPDKIGDVGIIPTKLALIHDEVSEALQVHREQYDDSDEDVATVMTQLQEEDFTEELADIIIRVLDVAGYYDLEIGLAVTSKIEKNRGRTYKHGKRY